LFTIFKFISLFVLYSKIRCLITSEISFCLSLNPEISQFTKLSVLFRQKPTHIILQNQLIFLFRNQAVFSSSEISGFLDHKSAVFLFRNQLYIAAGATTYGHPGGLH
jgi:hypothetical protein